MFVDSDEEEEEEKRMIRIAKKLNKDRHGNDKKRKDGKRVKKE